MTVLERAAEIRDALAAHRNFQECLLMELRTTTFGTGAELHFEYLWDDTDPDGVRLASTPRRVVLRLELVRELRFVTALPEAILKQPEQANWGLTEVAQVRLADQSQREATPTLAGAHHLVIEWESPRRVDALFQRLRVQSPSQ